MKVGILDPEGNTVNPLNDEPYSVEYREYAKAWSSLPAYKDVTSILKSIKNSRVMLVRSDTGSGKTVLIPKFCLHYINYGRVRGVSSSSGGGGGGGGVKDVANMDIITVASLNAKGLSSGCIDHTTQLTQITTDVSNGKMARPGSASFTSGIIVSLPKRMIVESAASYAAKTLDVPLGSYVGYKFKGVVKASQNTVLMYVSDGTLTTYLNSCIEDPSKLLYKIIIVDEIHERKEQVDINLYLIRQLMYKHADVKCILMSADVDPAEIKTYFKEFTYTSIMIRNPPLYKVKVEHSPPSKSADAYMDHGIAVIKKLKESKVGGNYLFFCPSIADTKTGAQRVRSDKSMPAEYQVLSIYSDSNDSTHLDSLKNFAIDDVNGSIVFSTNVAESSLTIPNTTVVIDSGLEVVNTFNPVDKTYTIGVQFISRAQMIQRKGRTGRTSNGRYIAMFKIDDIAKDYPIPDILKNDISKLILEQFKYKKIVGDTSSKDNDLDSILPYTNKLITTIPVEVVRQYVFNLIELDTIDTRKMLLNSKGVVATELPFSVEESICVIESYKHKLLFETVLMFTLGKELAYTPLKLIAVRNTGTTRKPDPKYKAVLTQVEKAMKTAKSEHMWLLNIAMKYSKSKLTTPTNYNTKLLSYAIKMSKQMTGFARTQLVKYMDPRNNNNNVNNDNSTGSNRIKILKILASGLQYNTKRLGAKYSKYACNQVVRLKSGDIVLRLNTSIPQTLLTRSKKKR